MKTESIEELNRLGKAWFEAKPEDKAPLAESIFLLAYKLFPEYKGSIGEFFISDWKNFDPNIVELYGYLSKYLKWRSEDLYHKDFGHRRLQVRGAPTAEEDDTEDDNVITVSEEEYEELLEKAMEKEESGNVNRQKRQTERLWTPMPSLDAPIRKNAKQTWLDQFDKENSEESPLEALLCEETAMQFIALALSLPERLTGRAKNPTRINYFRMYFTDSVVDILHKAIDTLPFERHERELFDNAIKTAFLDFFMRKVCRRVSEIEVCPLKFWGEMVEGRGMDIIPEHPLPIDVYLAYLNREEGRALRADSVISNHRTEYEKWLRENLQC